MRIRITTRRIVLMFRAFCGSGWSEAAPLRFFHRVAHRVVQAADGVLNPTDGLVGPAVVLQLGVSDSFADGLFGGAFDLLDRTGDSVLVHDCSPQLCAKKRDGPAL